MTDGIHQVAAAAAPRDAITHHMLEARAVLRGLGLRSEIFVEAGHIHGPLLGDAQPVERWSEVAAPADAAIIHYSIASPAVFHVLDRCRRCALHYHNITPAELLWRHAPRIALECAIGRRRLGELAGRVVRAGAVSRYNADELERLGFPEPSVLGVMRAPLPPAPRPVGRRQGRARLLFVGRGVPNKAQHHMVMTSAALVDAGLDHELTLVGSWSAAPEYERHCQALATTLRVADRVRFAGSVSDAQLARNYAEADLFLCLSDHEGFCVPIVEAMAAGMPVVAYASSAIPETLGEAGLLLGDKPPSLVAEAVIETLSNPALGARMAAARDERLRAVDPEELAGRLVSFAEAIPVKGFHLGDTVPPALVRALGRIAERMSLDGVVVAAGADDPGLAARLPEGPRVVVPAIAARTRPPWTETLLRSADVIVTLDRSETATLPGALDRPVVLAGLPRPDVAPGPAHGLDAGGHEALASLWRSEVGPLPSEGPGVAWVGGSGLAAVAAATEAWVAGHAVVALPRTPRHDMLARGGALTARTSLEAIEATLLLRRARPLAQALAARGRRTLSSMKTLDEVAGVFAEAVVLALEGRA